MATVRSDELKAQRSLLSQRRFIFILGPVLVDPSIESIRTPTKPAYDGKPPSREELAAFLRASRGRVKPLPGALSYGRRRVKGLRREEVAERAGIGVAWYTWLEQARPINVSAPTLGRIAQALELQPQERRYLFALAGQPLAGTATPEATPMAPLRRVLDALDPAPALLLDPCWDVLGANAAANELFGSFDERSAHQRNLMWLLFTDPGWRALHGDWEHYARCSVRHLRMEVGATLKSERMQELTVGLMQVSPEFREWWTSHEVLTSQLHQKTFHHPVLGTLYYDLTVLEVQGSAGLKIFAYSPSA